MFFFKKKESCTLDILIIATKYKYLNFRKRKSLYNFGMKERDAKLFHKTVIQKRISNSHLHSPSSMPATIDFLEMIRESPFPFPLCLGQGEHMAEAWGSRCAKFIGGWGNWWNRWNPSLSTLTEMIYAVTSIRWPATWDNKTGLP